MGEGMARWEDLGHGAMGPGMNLYEPKMAMPVQRQRLSDPKQA